MGVWWGKWPNARASHWLPLNLAGGGDELGGIPTSGLTSTSFAQPELNASCVCKEYPIRVKARRGEKRRLFGGRQPPPKKVSANNGLVEGSSSKLNNGVVRFAVGGVCAWGSYIFRNPNSVVVFSLFLCYTALGRTEPRAAK
jgi:hypothetical protein